MVVPTNLNPRPTSPSPSRHKRPLSSPHSSASKRANSEDLMDQNQLSDTEYGASRLNIASTPASPSSDEGQGTPQLLNSTPPSPRQDDAPPAYEPRAFSGPPGDVQLEIIGELKRGQLEVGEAWFLVARPWYRRWQTACSGNAESKEDDTSITVEQVGAIDNSSLEVDGKLKKPLVEGIDVELLPASAYNMLKEWYGSIGPDFERIVVSTGTFGSERVEFYPPTFQIFLLLPVDSSATSPVSVPSLDSAPTISLASSSPFSSLRDFAATSFSLGRPVRLWRLPEAGDSVSASEGPAFVLSDKLHETGVELLELPDDTSLEDGLLSDPETRIAVEQSKPDGTWLVDSEAILTAIRKQQGGNDESSRGVTPQPETSTSTTTTTTTEKKGMAGLFSGGWHNSLHKPKSNGNLASSNPTGSGAAASGSGGFMGTITGALTRSKTTPAKGQRGLTGLQNLGNTCFMNSAIQCMSNTKELKDYFLSQAYKDELNPDNPLGMRGEVAEQFGQLIERMWHGSGSSVAPREFKKAVSRFAPQFSGYGQQDSQELLAFLLDGTHEDLNRILKKPATSAPDWEGGGDKELVEMAKTCWEQYRSRNDSVIVDLFQGQYRSTVVCPDCDKVSITFDPFMYVTTNLPVTKKWIGTVYVVPIDPSRSVISLEVEVPKNGTLKTLKSCVGKILDMDPKRLVITEEWHGKFFKEWPDDEMVSEINTKNDKIVIYEVAGPVSQPRFRKNKVATTPEDPDAPIFVVVNHQKASSRNGSSRMTFGSYGSSAEYFGSPFILSLTREEASTIDGIKGVIAKQYARLTKLDEEFLETIEGEFNESNGQGARSEPQPADDAPPNVNTETPADSPSMQVDDELPSSLDVSSSSTSPTASTSSLLPPPVPSTAPSTPVRRSLFTIEVSKTRRDTALPMSQSSFSVETIPLADRAAAFERVVNEDYDMFSSSNGDNGKAKAENQDPSTEPSDSTAPPPPPPPAAPRPSRPLVRTGDFLVCEWEPAVENYFFGKDTSKWEQVEEIVDPAVTARRALGKQKQTITLDQCLTEFTKEERLGEEDMWYCSACKDFKQATKKVEIWKAPDVLVFALKRFSSGRYSRDKIDDFVDFPLEGFDMEPFVEGDKVERRLAQEMGEGNAPAISEPDSLLYDLYAVSNHFGGLGGGHYTAFAKNPDNNKWYDFDDSRVSPLSDPTRAVSSSAYLLFYRRRTARPIGGAKSISAVESALQSRVNSTVPSQVASLNASPMGSRENLPSMLDDDSTQQNDELLSGFNSYGDMPGSFENGGNSNGGGGGGGGFMGMFQPRTLTMTGGPPSNASNEPPSPKSLNGEEEEIKWDSTPPRPDSRQDPDSAEEINLDDSVELEVEGQQQPSLPSNVDKSE